ncbi:hypothetical protein Psuf_049230 [Phytohabitans suffuscus]|uniref:Uncharacterized protein n=1 Tax=Phytohabitans suffuscus TaxID=624315 RepID=A0A6F8YNB9_9ACTN|nr:hypothetical protein Psuf_049230 [Phytohabitans suffuscus]
MLHTRTVTGQRRVVLGRHVALVLIEAVLREALVQVDHDPVSGDLGEHAGRGHAGGHLVALPHGQPGNAQPVDAEAVGQHVLRAGGQRGERPAHRREVAHVQAAGVYLGGRDDHDGVRERALDHLGVDTLAGGGGEQLGVGQLVDLAALALGEHRRGGHQRARTRPAPRLVGPGHDAEATALQRPLKGVDATLPAYHRARRRQHDASAPPPALGPVTPSTRRSREARSFG